MACKLSACASTEAIKLSPRKRLEEYKVILLINVTMLQCINIECILGILIYHETPARNV